MITESVSFTSNGKMITLHYHGENEHIGNIIRKNKNFYDYPALQVIKNTLDLSNKTVLDIGANVGNHSVFFATVCGAKVLAIEPNIDNYLVLQKNSEGKSIIPVRILIGNGGEYSNIQTTARNMGAIKFILKDDGNLGDLAYRLDGFGFQNVALIKIDVEGMELDVLEGARKLIDLCHPAIMIEVSDHTKEIYDILKGYGYNIIELVGYTRGVLAI